MKEIWLPIVRSKGKYRVSNTGLIRHVSQPVPVACMDRNGYLKATARVDGITINMFHHREVALAFLGEPGAMTVDHLDGDKTNNKLSNLEYVTIQENIKRRGKYKVHNRAKRLSIQDVGDIRSSFSTMNNSMIARKFGVHRYVIRRIRSGRTYSS